MIEFNQKEVRGSFGAANPQANEKNQSTQETSFTSRTFVVANAIVGAIVFISPFVGMWPFPVGLIFIVWSIVAMVVMLADIFR